MILKSKVDGVPNSKQKQFISPAAGNTKARLKTGDYTLIAGEEYEVNFPEKESNWEIDENGKRVKKETAYEIPPWFESKKSTNKIPRTEG